jgi:hypothetical protein
LSAVCDKTRCLGQIRHSLNIIQSDELKIVLHHFV